MQMLFVTVDSLRRDHFEYLPKTRSFVVTTQNRVSAPSTATTRGFPGIIGWEFANGADLTDENVSTRIGENSVGLTTNQMMSEEYGIDVFDLPKGRESE